MPGSDRRFGHGIGTRTGIDSRTGIGTRAGIGTRTRERITGARAGTHL